MRARSIATSAACAAAMILGSSSAAFAGEVTGPPGSTTAPPSHRTGAPAHSNSICSYSGLNDFNQGPTVNRTQTPANQGAPGDPGTNCRGGSNPENPPS
jgi:hypothetical protein